MRWARTGAVFFGLWGLLHLVGGTSMLFELGRSAEAGYALYRNAGGAYPPAAGAMLGMAGFSIGLIGAVVMVVALALNWRNRPLGAALNLALAGGMDLALVLFLLIPGFVDVGEALVGLALLAGAVLFTGLALFKAPALAEA